MNCHSQRARACCPRDSDSLGTGDLWWERASCWECSDRSGCQGDPCCQCTHSTHCVLRHCFFPKDKDARKQKDHDRHRCGGDGGEKKARGKWKLTQEDQRCRQAPLLSVPEVVRSDTAGQPASGLGQSCRPALEDAGGR